MVASIGFFSPLPLAMMIPFMATQSLAMGEAFGKSFQYGKRKISAMSNDEFNNYSMEKMMEEQTSNYRMIIPKLHEQMEASQQMQHDIFTEMLKIIPTFMNTLLSAFNATTGGSRGEGNELPFGGITIPDSNIVAATTETPSTDLQLISHENLLPAPTAPSLSTQEQLQFQALVETTSNAEIQTMYDNLSSFPNWKKSLIVEQWNKRGLNPQNQQLDTSTLIQGLEPTPVTAEALYWTEYTGKLTVLLKAFLQAQETYIYLFNLYGHNITSNGGPSQIASSTLTHYRNRLEIQRGHSNDAQVALLTFTRNRPAYSNVNEERNKAIASVFYTEKTWRY